MKIMASGCAVLALWAGIGPGAAQDQATTSAPAAASDPLVAWARIWGDTKGKGVFTCEEWKQYAAKLFNQADRNHDGYLDVKEFEYVKKADPMLKDAEFAYFDDHRHGRVSRSEFTDKPNPLFTSYDAKGTCKVRLEDIAKPSAR